MRSISSGLCSEITYLAQRLTPDVHNPLELLAL
jgi:hypothetical protein